MSDSEKWTLLSELWIAIYDLETEEVQRFAPELDERIYYADLRCGAAEKAVSKLYEKELEYSVQDINHKHRDLAIRKALGFEKHFDLDRNIPDVSSEVVEAVENKISEHVSKSINESPVKVVEGVGRPDLLVYSNNDAARFMFVEVKGPSDSLGEDQKQWLKQFDFLPRKLAYVFEDKRKMEKFVTEHTVNDLLKEEEIVDEQVREEMEPDEIAAVLKDLEVGALFYYDGQELPLEVLEKDVTWDPPVGGKVTGVKATARQGNTKLFSKNGDWVTAGDSRRSIKWIERC